MYAIILSSGYRKALKHIVRHKDFNAKKLEEVISALSRGEELGLKHRNHELKGKLVGLRECHIQNNMLLVYKVIKDNLILVLVDIGSHSDLF